MDVIYQIHVQTCSSCSRLNQYVVPMSGYSHVQAVLNFKNSELLNKSLVESFSCMVMDEGTSLTLEVESLMEFQDGLLFLTLPMSDLSRKNIVRVFLSLKNDCAQSRAHQFFTLRKG